MADSLSRAVAKRVSLGTVTVTGAAGTVKTGSTVVNLAKQALPIQGGILGSFNGACVVATVSTAITGAGASVEIMLQGSHDGVAFFNLAPAISSAAVTAPVVSAIVQNKFTVSATDSPSGALGQVTSMNFPGPLPQFIRGAVLNGTAASSAGVVTLEAVVLG